MDPVISFCLHFFCQVYGPEPSFLVCTQPFQHEFILLWCPLVWPNVEELVVEWSVLVIRVRLDLLSPPFCVTLECSVGPIGQRVLEQTVVQAMLLDDSDVSSFLFLGPPDLRNDHVPRDREPLEFVRTPPDSGVDFVRLSLANEFCKPHIVSTKQLDSLN